MKPPSCTTMLHRDLLHSAGLSGLQQPLHAQRPLSRDAADGSVMSQAAMSEHSSASEELARLSLGSVGHPHSCAGACRYVKRKGGCRDGANCSSCHLCFWRRTGDEHPDPQDEPSEKSEAFISIGTRGHPHQCGAPCRYVRRKGGCRDGASCTNCHACLWQRDRQDELASTAAPEEHSIPVVPENTPDTAVPDEHSVVFGDSGKKLQGLIVELLRQTVQA